MAKISNKFEIILLTGDMNYDYLDPFKSSTLYDICDIFDLLKNKQTCFIKPFIPFLLM